MHINPKHRAEVKKLVISAMFLSLGVLLPFLTGQIKEIGDSLLPMHIPVMLCGLICGAMARAFEPVPDAKIAICFIAECRS